MKLLCNLLLLPLLALSFDSLAFIPDFKMIMSLTAENHGRGLYKIVQNVTFESEPKGLVVRETWYIRNENQMRLEVRGRDQLKDLVDMTFIYDGARRIYIDSHGVKKVSRPGKDWFEPYFHFRFQKNIKPMMVASKMVPIKIFEKSTRMRKKRFNPKGLHQKQALLQLSRVGGTVAWAIGKPTPTGDRKALPGMWIEQDQFRILKLRFPSQAEILASNYSNYSHGLKLPDITNINWDNRRVQMQLVRAQSLPKTKKNKALLSDASLDFDKDPRLALKIPKIKAIIEFYKRFR